MILSITEECTYLSFFTGNYYSETLGFNTSADYTVVWDNGNGKP